MYEDLMIFKSSIIQSSSKNKTQIKLLEVFVYWNISFETKVSLLKLNETFEIENIDKWEYFLLE